MFLSFFYGLEEFGGPTHHRSIAIHVYLLPAPSEAGHRVLCLLACSAEVPVYLIALKRVRRETERPAPTAPPSINGVVEAGRRVCGSSPRATGQCHG